MKETAFYKLLIGILLLINIALVVFVLTRRPAPPRPHNDGVLVPSQLHLNVDQEKSFLLLAKKHKDGIESIRDEQSDLISVYLKTPPDHLKSIETISVLSRIAEMESNKLKNTKAHFEDVRKLLNEEQRENFEAFMENSLERILHNSPPKQRPGK